MKTVACWIFIFMAAIKAYPQKADAYIIRTGEAEMYWYTISWSDGSVYIGGVDNFSYTDFYNIKREGFGSLMVPSPKETYTGYWKNDRKHGRGIFIDGHNKVYKSVWVNGRIIPDSTVRIGSKEFIENFVAEGKKYQQSRFFTADEIKSMNPNIGAIENIRPTPLPLASRKYASGFPESFLFKGDNAYPMYAYETIYRDTLYTEKRPALLHKIDISGTPYKTGAFYLVEVLAGQEDTWSTYLVTLNNDGEILDMLESAICFYNETFLKKTEISENGSIKISSLKIVKSPYKYVKNIKELTAQELSEFYSITPEGKFKKVKEFSAPAANYTKESLNRF